MKSGSKETVALIGGYGKMGIWILDFLRHQGILESLSVLITGPREGPGRKAAEKYGCEYSQDNIRAAGARYIVFCTPLGITPDLLGQIGPEIEKDSVVMDICSVKTPVCNVAREVLDPNVEYISVHPMFGPSVSNLEGQVVILVPVNGGGFLEELREFLADYQARTLTTTWKEHDYVLGVVQCLTHFTYISVGQTLKEMDFDIGRSRAFASPVYELMVDMIGRILSGNPGMYAEIQMSNPYSSQIEADFIKNAKDLKRSVDSGDREAFRKAMIDAAKHYDDLDSSYSKSARAVSALYEELLNIENSVGEIVSIRNEATGAVHTGRLTETTPDYIIIGDGKRTVRMKTANASILPQEEIRRHRIEKYGMIQRDHSYLFHKTADPETIARVVEKCQKELVSAKVIDVYTGTGIPKERKSVTFRLSIFGDRDPVQIEREIRELITAMGAIEREQPDRNQVP